MGHLASAKLQLDLRKIVALILLAVTMMFLLLPSIYLRIKTDEGTIDLSDIISYEKGDLERNLNSEWMDFLMGPSKKDLLYVAKPLENVLCNIKDSKLAPFEFATTASSVSSAIGRYVKLELRDDSSFKETDEYGSFMKIKRTVTIIAFLLWLMCIAFCLSAIACAKRILFDDKTGAKSLTILIALYTVAIIGMVIFLNSKLKESAGFMYDFLDVLDELELLSYMDMEYLIPQFCVMAFPFLSLICSIAVGIVPNLIPENIDVKAPTIPNLSGLAELSGISLDTGWICECGKKNKASATFCAECGKKRVDYSRCENCGAVLARGSAFCSKCGTPVNRKVFEPVCPSCGKSLKSGTKFCIYCGTPINSDAEAAPAAEPRTGAADEYTRAPEIRPESRAPEMRPEKRTESGHTPSPAKSPAAEEQQSSGRLKIKRGGGVEYK